MITSGMANVLTMNMACCFRGGDTDRSQTAEWFIINQLLCRIVFNIYSNMMSDKCASEPMLTCYQSQRNFEETEQIYAVKHLDRVKNRRDLSNKMMSFQYRDSQKDNLGSWPSYLHNENLHVRKDGIHIETGPCILENSCTDIRL